MSDKTYSDELGRALSRPDAEEMCRLIDALAGHHAKGGGWPEEHADAFSEFVWSGRDDPDKALASVVLAASRTDDAGFLAMLASGVLEDVLRNPSDELLDRIVAEARKSARFRWLLSHPFQLAVSPRAWAAIEKYRMAGPREEPSGETLPPRT